MNRSLAPFLAWLGLAAAAALAAPDAQAYSHITHHPNASVAPQSARQTTSRLRIEGKDASGGLAGIRYCPAGANCFSTVPGAVTNVVVLEYDPNREEVLSEKCRGVASTVPQLRCENGDLEVVLRVRMGELVIKVIGDTLIDSGSAIDRTRGGGRYEFSENAEKYWSLSDSGIRFDSTARAYLFPAGAYKMSAPDLAHHCKPVHANPGFAFDLPPGGRTSIEIRYRATECTVLFTTDVAVSGLTMTSDRGAVTCEAKGQLGIPTVKSVCTGVFPFNQTVTVSASVPAGLVPYFAWVSNTCERTGDTTKCRFKPSYDSNLDIFTDIKMRAAAAGAPVPPVPVGLAFARSASSPSEGNAAKGEASVPMLQLQATAQNGTAMVHALTVKAAGTGRDDLDLPMLKVVVDANGNGAFDAGETVLAQGRPSADDGELRLAFGSAIAVADTANLLVVADIGSEVHSAAAAVIGGSTLLLAFGLLAVPAHARRRRWLPLTALALALAGSALLAGCGGGGSDEEEATEFDTAVVPGEPPPVVAPPVAPVLLTYRLDLVSVEATDSASPAAPLIVRSLPVPGITLNVQQ